MSVLSAWLCLEAPVHAQAVALDLSACSSPPASEVRAVLAVELRGQLLPEDASPPADAQSVEVRCSEDQAVLSLRGTALQRTVQLSSVPAGLRARLLALSVAELARPQPSAAEAPAPPVVEPAAPRASPPEPSAVIAAPVRTPGYLLWAAAEAQATPLLGFGAALLLRARVRELLAWSSAISLGQAHADIPRGRLNVLSVSLRTGPALLLENSRASLQVGAGVRAGFLRLNGAPADAERNAAASFTAWYLGPALFAGVSWSVTSHVFVALELEGAHALRAVRARVEGANARTLSPWRSSAALGAGVAW